MKRDIVTFVLICIFLIFTVVLGYTSTKGNRSYRARCEAIGGVVDEGYVRDLCLRKDAILNP